MKQKVLKVKNTRLIFHTLKKKHMFTFLFVANMKYYSNRKNAKENKIIKKYNRIVIACSIA